MIGGQGEDSCGKSRTGETLQERMRRGGLAAARGKRKSCMEINCCVTSGSAHVSHLFVLRLNLFRYVSTSFSFYLWVSL
ncbi:hypothetical protein ACFVSZ_23245 [Priestia megaterium]|uniref:hypothetical protein n=1 Tax=Priestia megaterium TaxID=1404 RepID=UPI0036D7ABA0